MSESSKAGFPRYLANHPIIVVCDIGHRASLIESYNVLGSMKAWIISGYPVERG